MKAFLRITGAATMALAATSAHAKTAMPQMDPTWFVNQLFWLAITFAALYFVVARFIAPTVGGVLEKRESAIREAIATAEQLKETASNTRGDFEAAGTEARAKAAATIAGAQASAAKAAADAHAKLAAELEAKTTAAKQTIGGALSKAQSNLDEAATSLAVAMSEKLLGSKVAAADVKSAVAQAKKA